MISSGFKSFFVFFLFSFFEKNKKVGKEAVVLKISAVGGDFRSKSENLFQEIKRIQDMRRSVCCAFDDSESGIRAFNTQYPQEAYELELMTEIYFCHKVEVNGLRRILQKEGNFDAVAYNNACVKVRSYCQ